MLQTKRTIVAPSLRASIGDLWECRSGTAGYSSLLLPACHPATACCCLLLLLLPWPRPRLLCPSPSPAADAAPGAATRPRRPSRGPQ